MNISSIVVQTTPKFLEEVLRDIKACDVCDYHLHDAKGRIIITIEGESVDEELKKLRVIEAIPHVIAADMQMAYSEDELDRNIDVINHSDAVPAMLNDDTIEAKDIIYNGDLKQKMDLEAFAKQLDKGQ